MKFQDVPSGRQFRFGNGGIWLVLTANEAKQIASGVRRSFGPEDEVDPLAVAVELWATDKCSGCGVVCRLRTIEARGKYGKGVPVCIPCAIAG